MSIETLARDILNAKSRGEYVRLMMRAQRCKTMAGSVTRHTRTCPACGTGMKIRVIEHPKRERGIDGHTVFVCMNCGLSRTFDYVMDEGRRIGEEYIPGVTGRTRVTMNMDGTVHSIERK